MRLHTLVFMGVLCWIISGAAYALSVDDFLYFEKLELKKEKNGQVTQTFAIRFHGPDLDFLNVYFQQNQDAAVYQAEVENRAVSITSAASSFFRLFAFGGYGNRRYVAQTHFCLFGKSKIKIKRKPAVLSDEFVPLIEIVSPEFSYWPQTGQHFKFKINSDFSVNDVTAFVLEKQHVKTLVPNTGIFFSYIPAHDKQLRDASISAVRQDTVFARIISDKYLYHITCALFLHRSRTAFVNQRPGVAACLVTVLFFWMWIVMKRKRSKTPW